MVAGNNSETGKLGVKQILNNLYLKRMNRYFQKYKSQCYGGDEGNKQFRSFCGKFGAFRLRDAFNWWKKKHEIEDQKDDLNDTGPVRAEHWLAEKEIENIKSFMKDQHYTSLEINKFYNDVCATTENRMKKHMIRMKYKQDPKKRLLPIVMDRWKGFVAIRKNVKHQFKFLANFKENQKADM